MLGCEERKGVGEVRVGQAGRGGARGGERPMGAAACGGRGFKGRARGKWREAGRRRHLRTAIHWGGGVRLEGRES